MEQAVVEGFRLSPQQRRLWRHLEEGSRVLYRSRCRVRVSGALDAAALESAVHEVSRRLEILRTEFEKVPGMALPVQIIRPTAAPRLALHDLVGCMADEQEREIARIESALATSEAALAVAWIRLAPDAGLLLLDLPAMWADAAGVVNLAGDLAAAYSRRREGAGWWCDNGGTQYADLAEVFNQLLESEEAAQGTSYWQAVEFDGALDLALPPAAVAGQAASGVIEALLPEEVAVAVEKLAGERRVAPADALFSCWLVLLWRFCERPARITVGRAFDGRNFEGLEGAVGLFARYLPVAEALLGDEPFTAVLGRVAAAVAAAAERQEYFDWEAWAGSGREGAFFSAGFEWQPRPPRFAAGGVTFEPLAAESRFDRCDLLLRCARRAEGLTVQLGFDPRRLGPARASQLLASFGALVRSATTDPGLEIEALDLTSDEDRRWFAAWNDTAADFPVDRPFHTWVEEWAAREPEAVAVEAPEGAWTYAELDGGANRLARALRERGVGGETTVGVCLERTRELPLALLAVLKAGGAYLPIDPVGPRERAAAILAEAGARVVLTARRLRDAVPGGFEALAVDEVLAGHPWRGEPAPGVAVHPRQLAYLLYTSGSTGRPKGVMVDHRNLVNYLLWIDRMLSDRGVRFLPLITRPTFDASLKQLFAPLLRGGTVWVLPEETLNAPSRLLAALASRPGAGLNCVTSLWRTLVAAVEEGRSAVAPERPVVFVGGERLDEDLLRRSFAALPRLELWNLYGPTEVTANATAGRLDPDGPVSLGRPIANGRVYLLDEGLRLVGGGLSGEICTGGEGVARGYLGRPDLTAERFVPDSWSGVAGARLYRTGDLARILPEGALQFLGRRDQQVKVRGIRIELEEVEAVLRLHPAVADCAVSLHGGEGEEARLVAYLELSSEAAPSERDLRRFHAESLPEAMVPSWIVVLPQLPRTASGKLDRRALPAPTAPVSREVSFHAPRTAVEQVLGEIWADLLGVERVGLLDDFYQLGGHSLMAVQLLSRIYKVFDVEISLRAVLDAGSLAAVAACIEAARARSEGLAPPPLVRAERRDRLPLSFSQERLWFLSQLEPESPAYNIPAALRLRGAVDVAALAASFGEIVSRHEVLRTRFVTVEGRPERRVDPSAPVPLAVVDLADLGDEARKRELLRLAGGEAARPFDLAADPPLRAGLVRLGDEDWALLATWHHIATDGWSSRVLLQELTSLYEALTLGAAPPLDTPPLQYADYAAWQRRWLQGETLERIRETWRRRLAGSSPTALPADWPRPVRPSSRGAAITWRLDGELAGRLKALSRREGCTLFMTLLAGFKAAVHSLTGTVDVVVGTDAVNRLRPETERSVGLFVNQLVLRTDLSGDPTLRELLARVRETALAAYEHQELPFNVLVEAARPGRDLGKNPLFQIMFAYLNLPSLPPQFAGIPIEPLRAEVQSTVFDLSLYIQDAGEDLAGTLRYSTDLFEPRSMERLWRRFESVLCLLAERPDTRLGEAVEALVDAERQREVADLERIAGEKLSRLRSRRGKVPSASTEEVSWSH